MDRSLAAGLPTASMVVARADDPPRNDEAASEASDAGDGDGDGDADGWGYRKPGKMRPTPREPNARGFSDRRGLNYLRD